MTDAAPSTGIAEVPLADVAVVVGVVGAGTMGAGIAEVAARAGHPVRLFDAAEGAGERGRAGIASRLDRDVSAGRLTREEADDVLARVQAVRRVPDLADCGLVVEAVVEDVAVKRSLLASLEDVVADGTVLATNTSSLSVTAVAAGLRNPSRVVGLHFFNPAPRMRLVEVVHGDETDPAVADAAVDLVSSWGKTPVRCRSTPGFIVNRVARPYYGEAQRLVEEGVAEPAVIDRILRDAGGFPMGPFELTDLVGQDVNLSVARSVWEQTFHDPRYAPTVFQQRLVDAGRLGRKTGRGVFRYETGPGHATDPEAGPRPELPEVPRALPPTAVRCLLGWSVMAPLSERIMKGPVEVTVLGDSDPECADDIGLLLPSGGRLVETTGVPAGRLGDQVVTIDWAASPESTRRVAMATSPDCSEATVAEAVGLVQSAGVEVELVADVAGLVVARTVAMLVNEAVDLVARGEATAQDVDTAMRLGTGYPHGPLEWGDLIGPSCVLEMLENLHKEYPTGRYRPSPALRRAAETGAPLRA